MPAARGATQADLDAVLRASSEESLRVKRATLDVCIPTICHVLCEMVDSVPFPDAFPS